MEARTMIRRMQQAEAPLLGDIWLEASLVAHDFIEPEYWKKNRDAMVKNYIPHSDTYVHETNGVIDGFVSIVDNTDLAAIFVSPASQGRGIGSELMAFAKEMHDRLSLHVYSKNKKSIAFYEKQGFVVQKESIDHETGEPELLMVWSQAS